MIIQRRLSQLTVLLIAKKAVYFSNLAKATIMKISKRWGSVVFNIAKAHENIFHECINLISVMHYRSASPEWYSTALHHVWHSTPRWQIDFVTDESTFSINALSSYDLCVMTKTLHIHVFISYEMQYYLLPRWRLTVCTYFENADEYL